MSEPVSLDVFRARREAPAAEFVSHEVRAIFAGFAIEEVRLNYRISGGVTAARELIISTP